MKKRFRLGRKRLVSKEFERKQRETKLYKLYQAERKKLTVLDVISTSTLILLLGLHIWTKSDLCIFGIFLNVFAFFVISLADFQLMTDYKAVDAYLTEVEMSKQPTYNSNRVNELRENLTEKQRSILECWKTSK